MPSATRSASCSTDKRFQRNADRPDAMQSGIHHAYPLARAVSVHSVPAFGAIILSVRVDGGGAALSPLSASGIRTHFRTHPAQLRSEKKQTCGLLAYPLTHCVRARRPHAEICSDRRLFSTRSSLPFKLSPLGVEPSRPNAPPLPLLVPIGDRSDQCLHGRQ